MKNEANFLRNSKKYEKRQPNPLMPSLSFSHTIWAGPFLIRLHLVLRFYGPMNTNKDIPSQSLNLCTLFLGSNLSIFCLSLFSFDILQVSQH